MSKKPEVVTAEHLAEINADVISLLIDGFAAHIDTNRGAAVTVRYAIRRNSETGKHEVTAKLGATIPKGRANSLGIKRDPVVLIAISDDIPGQQMIGG